MRFSGESVLHLRAAVGTVESRVIQQVPGKADPVHLDQASWHCPSLALTAGVIVRPRYAAANMLAHLSVPA